MIVTRGNFDKVIELLSSEPRLGADTETTGLRMYHGHKIFSIIIATKDTGYYFNFWPEYPGLPQDHILGKEHFYALQLLAKDPDKRWYIQNAANFDLCMFAQDKIEFEGEIFCTRAIGRVEFNDHEGYHLSQALSRIGLSKLDVVAKYIEDNKLFHVEQVPGKAQREKVPYYYKVPFEIIVPYGEADALGTIRLGLHLEQSIEKQDQDEPLLVQSGRSVRQVMDNEMRLQKTIFRMKHRGVLIDRKYCIKAQAYEKDRAEKAAQAFKRETGRDYSASGKLFAEIFASEKELWTYTDKGNPSFDADAIKKLNHPAARHILDMRDAKSKSDFYLGFLYHADANGVVHPNYNPDGTVHGRFSSSAPNFQNLSNEKEEEEIAQEFVVRRAIIPRPGFVLIAPDYSQMEYKFMLEQACRLRGALTPFAELIVGGMDFHDATKANVKLVTGTEHVRKQIKIVNFMTLYGAGIEALAAALKVPPAEAKKIRNAILTSAPEVNDYLEAVKKTAKERGFIVNWFGRRCHFPNRYMNYKAPNYHISGGCADVVKIAMNRIDEALLGMKSKMIMTVHDELPSEIHESEIETVPKLILEMMETTYPHKYIPLTASMAWSEKSLGDLKKGFPV